MRVQKKEKALPNIAKKSQTDDRSCKSKCVSELFVSGQKKAINCNISVL